MSLAGDLPGHRLRHLRTPTAGVNVRGIPSAESSRRFRHLYRLLPATRHKIFRGRLGDPPRQFRQFSPAKGGKGGATGIWGSGVWPVLGQRLRTQILAVLGPIQDCQETNIRCRKYCCRTHILIEFRLTCLINNKTGCLCCRITYLGQPDVEFQVITKCYNKHGYTAFPK